jgi:hypothetical protein
MSAVIDVVPEVCHRGFLTTVGFTARIRDRDPVAVQFEMEDCPEPGELAVTEAMMIAAIALAMQQRCVLRVQGRVSRSLRHTVDLYQQACAWWWPQRYETVPIDVDVVDDQPPATARGVLCFSGGVDSIYSAHKLGAARQIEAALLLEGYDIDIGHPDGQRNQRKRVQRLLDALGLQGVVIRTNARAVLGQEVIEGAQGSYLAAALTLLSDRFGRGFISSGLDLANIGESDPVHEAATPLLGSARYPLHVYGGPVSRLTKLKELATRRDLFRDVRVCQGRGSDDHCGRCSKCVLHAFACVALTDEWPVWLPQDKIDFASVAAIPPIPLRIRFAQEILQSAEMNERRGEWVSALAAWIHSQTAARKRPPRWRRLAAKVGRLLPQR